MVNKEKIEVFCDKFLYRMVVAIPFVASFSSAAVNIFIGLAIFTYLIKKIVSVNHWPEKTEITIPFLLLIAFSIISMRNSINLMSSLHGISKLLKYGFTLLIIYESIRSMKRLRNVIISIALGLLLACFDGIYQLHFGLDFLRNRAFDVVIGLPRLKAAFPHTNIFALYLGLMTPVCICIAFFNKKKKLFFTIVSILAVFCLLFTFSRGALLGFIAILLFIAIIQRARLLLLLLILGMLILPLVLPDNIKLWAKNTESLAEALLNPERIYIYKTSINMIKNHPFIGVGTNTFCINYPKYKVKQSYGNTGEIQYYAHNNFLHMAGEIGLIGLGIFIWLLFLLFRLSWRGLKHLDKENFLRVANLGIIAGIIAFLINGLLESGLYYSKVATLFWFQVGVLLSITKIRQKDNI